MKNTTNKILAVALAVTLLALAVVAGTLAYLTKETQSIKNVFTVGTGIDITLLETFTDAETGDPKTIGYSTKAGSQYYESTQLSGSLVFDPGKTRQKAITVTNESAEKSVYVFLEVTMGANVGSTAENKLIQYVLNETEWKCIAEPDGEENNAYIFAYVKGVDGEMPAELAHGVVTGPLFEGGVVTCKNVSSAELTNLGEGGELADSNIDVVAYAIQADLLAEDNLDTALEIFNHAWPANP